MVGNSWDYNDGESERRLGRALARDGYRDRALVMTKVDSHSYDGLMRQFSESLERLGLDRVDLLQLHEVIRASDAEDAVGRGALRAMVELRDQGAVGHIGVTGHKDPRYLVDIIDRAAEAGIRLETAQMPISAVDIHASSFTKMALSACLERGVEVLGMKCSGQAVSWLVATSLPLRSCAGHSASPPRCASPDARPCATSTDIHDSTDKHPEWLI